MTKAYKALPPASELWEMFDYKPLTGDLVSKKSAGNAPAGTVRGGIEKHGYGIVSIQKSIFKRHRIIWMWVTGKDPGANLIDHINEKRADNRWGNLRLATRGQNVAHTSKTKGYERLGENSYRVCIKKDGKRYHYGPFKTEVEAAAAHKKASLELHGEFSPYSETT